MAIGLSKLFNVNLPVNFNSPYKALNIIDFWRRWHMTLSAFLRDYLYIPLGGNRHSKLRRYINLMITMVLGGLWHGANWTFVVWGTLHGAYLVINHGWRALCERFALPKVRGGAHLAWAITFLAVVVAWIMFRAQNLEAAVRMVRGLVGLHGVGTLLGLTQYLGVPPSQVAVWLVAGLAVVRFSPNCLEIAARLEASRWRGRAMGYATGAVLFYVVMNINRISTFIYFQF
jgi:D-alanyl-lipoteichoic acid acyltransferase DltB (MBOAT superfamily)